MKLDLSPLAPARFPDVPSIHGVTLATGRRGFYASRDPLREDTVLCRFQPGTTAAGVFTRSTTASDDVRRCRAALESGGGMARALFVHAGNSNAFTGAKGIAKNAASLSALSRTLDVPENQCFVAATGVIGEPLENPAHMAEMVPDLARRLGEPDWQAAARAFMTTDTFPKAAGGCCEIAGVRAHITGIAKGSGMIAPNMATMLAYLFTDAAIGPVALDRALRDAVDPTFNSITVDGDISTSDTCMVFATARNGMDPIDRPDDPRLAIFTRTLQRVCDDLATQIVRDGEGASRLIEVRVTGADSDRSAKAVACAIANSPLVKTALAAGDANWGRIVMAVGKSLEPVDVERLVIAFGRHRVAEHGGRAAGYDEAAVTAVCRGEHIPVSVDLGVGKGTARVMTCDLTHAYIDINGAYRT